MPVMEVTQLTDADLMSYVLCEAVEISGHEEFPCKHPAEFRVKKPCKCDPPSFLCSHHYVMAVRDIWDCYGCGASHSFNPL